MKSMIWKTGYETSEDMKRPDMNRPDMNRPRYETSGYETSGYETSGYETSQNRDQEVGCLDRNWMHGDSSDLIVEELWSACKC